MLSGKLITSNKNKYPQILITEDYKLKKDSILKLLIEEAYELENIVESVDNKKNYYIHGVFSTIAEKNRNGRVYSQQLWEDNVRNYQDEIKNNSVNTLGELEHPSNRVEVDKMRAVIKIVELRVEGNKVIGKAKVLNNNSDATNHIKALIDEGMTIGVSSRGTGRMKGDIVEEYSLRTYDVVSSPSDYNANLSGLRESLEQNVHIDEKGKYICTPAGCTIVENKDIEKVEIQNESSDQLAKDFFESAKKIKAIVRSKSSLSDVSKYNNAVSTISAILYSIFDVDYYETIYEDSKEPNDCVCKAKSLIEALETFNKKDEKILKEKEFDSLKEKFDTIFVYQTTITEGSEQNKANDILKKELSKKYEIAGNAINGFSIKVGNAVGRVSFEEMYDIDFMSKIDKVVRDLKENNSFVKVELQKDGTIFVKFRDKKDAQQFSNQPGLKSIFKAFNVQIDHAVNGLSGDEFYLKVGK